MGTRNKKTAADSSSSLEAGRRRFTAAIRDASLEQLTQDITADIATFLKARNVRFYLRDPLTVELYTRYHDGQRMREVRTAVDPSSVVGYSAMMRQKSFAWKTNRRGDKFYIVAVPMVTPTEVLGVAELIHGEAGGMPDDAALGVFDDLVEQVKDQLKLVLKMSHRPTPYDHLLKNRKITPDILKEVREEASKSGQSTEYLLLTSHSIEKGELGRSLSEYFKCPFVAAPLDLPVSREFIRRFSPNFLRTHAVLPVGWKQSQPEFVVVNPRNLSVLDDIGRQVGSNKPIVSVAVKEDILAALDKLVAAPAATPEVQAVPAAPESAGPSPEEVEFEFGYDLAEKEAVQIDSTTIRLVNETIQAAIDQGASDIHFEPTLGGGLSIRFRVDGICHDYQEIRERVARAVVSRIKIMSQLDIAEHRLPQDGKIRLRDKQGRKTDLRVAVMPTQGGSEDVVLRILSESQALRLDDLGMERDTLDRFRTVIEQPHGIILCVGPTGAGKTTTLHAALAHLKGDQVKIWTAEDPVEITQEGIRQVQIQPKIDFTFQRALRSFLRCDPDIIMIGEIRDRETGIAAIEASLTGHLVLSTLHTNSAAETVTRLIEMGLDPFAFGDSLLAVLAQRLVRSLCTACRETYTPPAEEVQELRTQYGDRKGFEALCPDRRKLILARGKGCSQCLNTGYKGRLGIHELLTASRDVRRLIRNRGETTEIRKAALSGGMTILKQDGIRKVLEGKTDLNEIRSTTIEEDL